MLWMVHNGLQLDLHIIDPIVVAKGYQQCLQLTKDGMVGKKEQKSHQGRGKKYLVSSDFMSVVSKSNN